MNQLVFSQRSLSYLARINRMLVKELGFQFSLSNREHLTELLRASAVSPVSEIKQCFIEFARDLNEKQRDYISEMGVSLPQPRRNH